MDGNNLLIDTNIGIYAMNGNLLIIEKLNLFDTVFISSIALGELYFGAYNSGNIQRNMSKISFFLNECSILEVTQSISDCYGKIKVSLRQKGKPIPENDIWIAAFAIYHNLPLATNDGHFNEVDGINRTKW